MLNLGLSKGNTKKKLNLIPKTENIAVFTDTSNSQRKNYMENYRWQGILPISFVAYRLMEIT